MATLIPALGSCLKRMTAGERRFAERLEQKLEEDYLCWYDVPIGPATMHPDFVVLHPRRGLIILEVKDWKLDTIVEADRLQAVITTIAAESGAVVERLQAAHRDGIAWGDMSVIYSDNWKVGSKVLTAVRGAGIPAIDQSKATFASP
jgi:hypothetical protein